MRGVQGSGAADRDAVTLPALAIVGGSGAALLATLAARAVMARALAPAELGFVLLGVAVVSGVGGVASLGLAAAAGRRVAELRAAGRIGHAQASGRSALAIALAGGAAATAALWAVAAALTLLPRSGSLPGVLGVLAPVALGLAPGLAMVGVARGFGDFLGRPLIRDAAGGVLRLAAIAFAVSTGGGTRWIALGFTAGSLAGELGFVAYGARRGWLRRADVNGWDRELWRGLRPFSLMEVLNQLTQWVDMLVLGALGAPAAVGFYGVARSLSRALEIVHLSAAHSFLPSATAALHAGGRERFIRVYVRTRTLMFALLWPFLAVSIATPAVVILPLFGASYLPAAPVLRVLASALLVQVIFGYKDLALVALGSAASTARIGAFSFVAGVLVMLALVPRLGGSGAAAGVLVLAAVKGIAQAHVLSRTAGIRPWGEDVPPVVLAAAALTVAAWLLSLLAGSGASTTARAVGGAAASGSLLVFFSLVRSGR